MKICISILVVCIFTMIFGSFSGGVFEEDGNDKVSGWCYMAAGLGVICLAFDVFAIAMILIWL